MVKQTDLVLYVPAVPTALWTLPAVWQIFVDHTLRIWTLKQDDHPFTFS